jgi:hypothetical protein
MSTTPILVDAGLPTRDKHGVLGTQSWCLRPAAISSRAPAAAAVTNPAAPPALLTQQLLAIEDAARDYFRAAAAKPSSQS